MGEHHWGCAMADPWAILLIHFSDDDTEPFDRSWYEELFTEAGAGKWGLFDWFRDNSHGRVDLTGTKVFGWYELDMKTSDYKGSGANETTQAARGAFVETCKQKARDEGVALDEFAGVVVVLNSGRDLFGGGAGVLGGDDGANLAASGLAVGYMAQEMCHVYGLQHSKRLGAPDIEYGDRWDIMSGLSQLAAPNPTLTARDPRGDPVYPIGPGLNAANMWSRGWLDESRTWQPPGESVTEEITLRPLHRRNLTGYLAARFGELFIELRVPERWDAGFDQAAVFVHVFEEGMSWLVADSGGSFAWTAGSKNGIDALPAPPPGLDLGLFSLSVKSIDPVAQTATLRFVRSPGSGLEQFFPVWWPKRKRWLESERWSAGDSLLVTPADVLVIPATAPIHEVVAEVRAQQGAAVRVQDDQFAVPTDFHSPNLLRPGG